MVAGVTPQRLAEKYPRLYHMSHAQSWDGICRHGLLSTAALLKLFQVPVEQRTRLLTLPRRESEVVRHAREGSALIRDQKPLSPRKLERCLTDCTVPEWLQLLNSRVFFWLCVDRLKTLMCAGEYCADAHLVLVADTLRLATDLQDRITLAPMNTGNTRPFAHPRGSSTFSRITDYPFDQRANRGPYYAVVELAVEGGVPNIRDYLVEAKIMRCSGCGKDGPSELETLKRIYP